MQIVRIGDECIKEIEKTRQCAILKREIKLEITCPMHIQYYFQLPNAHTGVEP
jgi:hypothetical protein